MAKKRYKIDLNIIFKIGAGNTDTYFDPAIPAGLTDYEVRFFDTKKNTCFIEIDESVDIPSKKKLKDQDKDWLDPSAVV